MIQHSCVCHGQPELVQFPGLTVGQKQQELVNCQVLVSVSQEFLLPYFLSASLPSCPAVLTATDTLSLTDRHSHSPPEAAFLLPTPPCPPSAGL